MGRFPFAVPPKGKKMIIVFKYRDGKQFREKTIEIEFVSQWYHKEYRKVKEMINDFKAKYEALQNNVHRSTDAILKKDFDTIKKLESERKEIISKIHDVKDKNIDDEIVEKRYKLIEYLYTSNGLDYEGREWWEHHVEPDEANRIIDLADTKDFEDDQVKKKVLTSSVKNALLSVFQNTGVQSTENTISTK